MGVDSVHYDGAMARPLDGIRVLDFTRVVSGPSGTKALADLGAEVIKLEPPTGDTTRRAQPRVEGVPVYFAQQNAGKRCISIDLATDDGQALARRLADNVDVIVENFRPGVMARNGLGYDDITTTNPGVIYCSITGYGQDGPESGRRAYAPAVHAEVGLLEMTARRRREAVANEIASWADLQSGLQAALGIVAALHHRNATGRGQHIDVAMADVMLQMTEWTAVELAGGEGDGQAVFGPANAPVVTLADGSMASVPGDPVVQWPLWMQAVDDAELAVDPRFIEREDRVANRAQVTEALRGWAKNIPDFETFEQIIGSVGMAAGQVKKLADMVDASWAVHRESFTDIGETDPLLVPTSPFRFNELEAGVAGPTQFQGMENREVLREFLDVTDAELDRLEADGVLINRPFKR